MKRQVIAIYDRAADAFGQPAFVEAIGKGIRMFQDEVNRNQPDNQVFNHPDDFDLFHLGEYDDNTGQFTNLAEPKQLAIGKQMKINGGN